MGFICVLTRVSTVHLFKNWDNFSWSGLVKHFDYLSNVVQLEGRRYLSFLENKERMKRSILVSYPSVVPSEV